MALDFSGQVVAGNVALGQLLDHIQVVGVDVGEGEGGVGKLGHGKQVGHQAARKADRTGSDHGNFEGHKRISLSLNFNKERLAKGVVKSCYEQQYRKRGSHIKLQRVSIVLFLLYSGTGCNPN